ncbi:MAG: hypothetical protein COV76_00075 [Candidatus Omnitrophica bacterium CG11_big_fil_rev_8_21_14_0_20_64_10]|nr:MAG: hypothetical protein COV76_00075 [Candidatus Omnitrophica bacterium CG11_big_fil_rev_8_21_14_0_20_64_10]
MRIIEIPDNPNCAAADLRVFHDLAPARGVVQVCLEPQAGVPAWFEVTGWTLVGKPVPAFAQKVDDSGDGVAYLLFGGDAGLRFKPAGSAGSWSLQDSAQSGEPFLIIGDSEDLRPRPEAGAAEARQEEVCDGR